VQYEKLHRLQRDISYWEVCELADYCIKLS
jgi:hypothetical protein